jgi:hypothetical protein
MLNSINISFQSMIGARRDISTVNIKAFNCTLKVKNHYGPRLKQKYYSIAMTY